MNKMLNPIIDSYYKHKKILNFIPLIGLIIILFFIFYLKSTNFIFLTKINNAMGAFSGLFDISNPEELVRDTIVLITIWTGYLYWLKGIKIYKRNSLLVKIILVLISFLIITEHINMESSIGQFVDPAINFIFVSLIIVVLFFLSKEIKSINIKSFRSKTKDENLEYLSYIADTPITNPDFDSFKRWPFAQRIANSISSYRDSSSIVIGIYGAWGEGKSTILNFIEIELKKKMNIICVKFNPWHFEDENHLLHNFFQTLVDELGNDIPGKWLKDYASALSFTIGGIVQFSPNVGKSTSFVELDELKDQIGKLLKENGKRIVILMDDIDRLDKSEIQTVFKLVKLSANFSNTTYVLSFDEEMVSEALGEKYSLGKISNSSNIEAGRSFIEKIVQVPIHLPKPDVITLREKICFRYVNEALISAKIRLTDEENKRFIEEFVDCLEIRLKTPRIAKKYGNALFFSLPILKGEVNPIDLMLLEGMRIFYPNLYDFVRDNTDFLLGITLDENKKKHTSKLLFKVLEELNNNEKESAKKLLKDLFPFYGETATYHNPVLYEDLDKEQRIASPQYINRFFSYTLPDGDISDVELEGFIEHIKNDVIPDIPLEIKSFVEGRNPDIFISKLWRKAKSLSGDVSYKLALAIARVSDVFHDSIYLAVSLDIQLIKNIPNNEVRFNVAKTILTDGELSFASGFFQLTQRNNEKQDKDLIFTVEEETEQGKILTGRIRQFSKKGPIYILSPKTAPTLLRIWSIYGSRDETNKYIIETLNNNPQYILELLKCYPKTWFSASESIKGDFEKDDYEAIKEVVDVDVIYKAIYEKYGPDLNLMLINRKDKPLSIDEKVASQFFQIYHSDKDGISNTG